MGERKNMQITYNDPRFCFTGFWQENGAGELVSYKRVAAVSIGFRGTQIVLQARVDADAKWIIDGAEATPQFSDTSASGLPACAASASIPSFSSSYPMN